MTNEATITTENFRSAVDRFKVVIGSVEINPLLLKNILRKYGHHLFILQLNTISEFFENTPKAHLYLTPQIISGLLNSQFSDIRQIEHLIRVLSANNMELTGDLFEIISQMPLFAKYISEKIIKKSINNQEKLITYIEDIKTIQNTTLENLFKLDLNIYKSIYYTAIAQKFKQLSDEKKEEFIDAYFQEKGLFSDAGNRELLKDVYKTLVEYNFVHNYYKSPFYTAGIIDAFEQGQKRKANHEHMVQDLNKRINELKKDIPEKEPASDNTDDISEKNNIPTSSPKKNTTEQYLGYSESISDDSDDPHIPLPAKQISILPIKSKTQLKYNILCHIKNELTNDSSTPNKIITYRKKCGNAAEFAEGQMTILDEQRNPISKWLKKIIDDLFPGIKNNTPPTSKSGIAESIARFLYPVSKSKKIINSLNTTLEEFGTQSLTKTYGG